MSSGVAWNKQNNVMASDRADSSGDRQRSRSTGGMFPSNKNASPGVSRSGSASLQVNGHHASTNGHHHGHHHVNNNNNHLAERPPRVRRTSSSSNDRELRVVVMGAAGVGKTALVVRYVTRRYIGDYAHGESVCTSSATVDSKTYSVHIMDTVPGEIESQRIKEKLEWSDGVMLVFSLTDKDSFVYVNSLCDEITNALETSARKMPVVLVANKSDLSHLRKVADVDVRHLVTRLGCSLVETSASDSYASVLNAFNLLFHDIRVKQKRDKFSKMQKKGHSSKISHLRETLRNLTDFRTRTNTF